MDQAVGQLPAAVREGEIVGGKNRVENVLGAGGMGVVVAARHLAARRARRASSSCSPEALDSREAVARFLREARAAVKIKSEHVARVHDVGTLEDGAPYMVMEYLEGDDLADWLQPARAAARARGASSYVLQACEAIAEAHALGIVHRDLKPANLFLTRGRRRQPLVKVLDFGISKTTAAPAAGEFDHGDDDGDGLADRTCRPEQMRSSRNVDARTDIWALGAILYELVTGKLPYEGRTLPQVYATIVAQPQPSLRALSPDINEDLETVILRCLQRNRALRYRNVGELAAALMLFAPKRAHASINRIARVFSTTQQQPGSDPTHPASWPTAHTLTVQKTLASEGQVTVPEQRRRRSAPLAALAIALLVTVPLSIRWVLSPSAPSPSATVARPPPPADPLPESDAGAETPRRQAPRLCSRGRPRPSSRRSPRCTSDGAHERQAAPAPGPGGGAPAERRVFVRSHGRGFRERQRRARGPAAEVPGQEEVAMPRPCRLFAAPFAVAWLVVPRVLLAQPAPAASSESSVADALFGEGRALLDAGRYGEAIAKFTESEKLDPGVGTMLNLAYCYEKIGKTATAWSSYRAAAAAAHDAADGDRETFAEERARAGEPALAPDGPRRAHRRAGRTRQSPSTAPSCRGARGRSRRQWIQVATESTRRPEATAPGTAWSTSRRARRLP